MALSSRSFNGGIVFYFGYSTQYTLTESFMEAWKITSCKAKEIRE
jgi:hypothetical protein